MHVLLVACFCLDNTRTTHLALPCCSCSPTLARHKKKQEHFQGLQFAPTAIAGSPSPSHTAEPFGALSHKLGRPCWSLKLKREGKPPPLFSGLNGEVLRGRATFLVPKAPEFFPPPCVGQSVSWWVPLELSPPPPWG